MSLNYAVNCFYTVHSVWRLYIESRGESNFTISVFGSLCNYFFFGLIFSSLLVFIYYLTFHPAWALPLNIKRNQRSHSEEEQEIITRTAVHRNGRLLDSPQWEAWPLYISYTVDAECIHYSREYAWTFTELGVRTVRKEHISSLWAKEYILYQW